MTDTARRFNYEGASTEPLDDIRLNECENQVGSLCTSRFRARQKDRRTARTLRGTSGG